MNSLKQYQPSQRHWFLGALAVAAFATGSAMAAPAHADANCVSVTYRDLDLATDAGNRELYGRITRAAHQVCAAADNRDLAALAYSRACEREAVSQAVQTVHSARLVAILDQTQQRG